jgi:hypothetical protein
MLSRSRKYASDRSKPSSPASKKKLYGKKKPVKKQRPCSEKGIEVTRKDMAPAPAPPPTFLQRSAAACPSRLNAPSPRRSPHASCATAVLRFAPHLRDPVRRLSEISSATESIGTCRSTHRRDRMCQPRQRDPSRQLQPSSPARSDTTDPR